jgi:hypothetical protein
MIPPTVNVQIEHLTNSEFKELLQDFDNILPEMPISTVSNDKENIPTNSVKNIDCRWNHTA